MNRHAATAGFKKLKKVQPLCSNVPTRVARPRSCHGRGGPLRVVILHVKWGPQGPKWASP